MEVPLSLAQELYAVFLLGQKLLMLAATGEGIQGRTSKNIHLDGLSFSLLVS